jgi:hypothetical protein
MKILTNALQEHMERWSDPGDYPNGLAGGPLPSRNFVADVTGTVVIECTGDELLEALSGNCDLQSELDLVVELENCKVDSWTASFVEAGEAGKFNVGFEPYHWSE